jgi:uncharacterized membrane protein
MYSRDLGKSLTLATVVAAALAIPALAATQQGGPAEQPTFKSEKCYGISKAGKNDCAATGNNSCAGHSKLDADKKAWLFVPAGYCERIVGGSTAAR